jgi:glycolate oxidase
LRRDLRRRLGEEAVLETLEDRYVHSFDATATIVLPAVVVVPATIEDLVWVCEALWEAGVATTPRGAGTGYAGGAVPAAGGAVVVCDRLKGVGGPAEGIVTVEPGVVGDDLNRFLKRAGRFYPVDPASAEASTLGGHVATNAGGPRAVKYGVTRDYVVSAEVVSPGRGREVYRSDPGTPDTLSVLVGSEGTLAVFLRIRLRVAELPEATAAAVASFAERDRAGEAATAVLEAVLPSKLEFVDHRCLACLNAQEPGTFEEGAEAVLMLEFDGASAAVAEELDAAAALLRAAGALAVGVASDREAAERLWRLRRGISPALGRLAPHKINEDVCLPLSQIPAGLNFIGELERRYDVPVPTFGHVGDGNLHVNFMYDRRRAGERERVEAAVGELMVRVVELGGTITGEHGVGLAKMPYLGLEQTEAEAAYAARIKGFFDPEGILNPGKIYGPPRA